MCSVESVLKDLPVLFCSLVPEGSFQGVPLTNFLNSWKFAFLKFRVLTLLKPCINRLGASVSYSVASHNWKER